MKTITSNYLVHTTLFDNPFFVNVPLNKEVTSKVCEDEEKETERYIFIHQLESSLNVYKLYM